ncbi:MAG TPA: AAA family ATPase [Acidimicrobiales bacterium]|nr:AAA family ATPase [Acidimicrobiales bacterium]
MAAPEGSETKELLVGRRAELQAIAAALGAAWSGHPLVVWVEGDAGMGKTALVRQAVTGLLADVEVVRAQADELASSVPFELARRLGASSNDTFRAGLEILETWSHHQDHGPLAVIVEDLHWADPDSSKALLCATQRLDVDRVVVFVTTRPVTHDGWQRVRVDPERCRRITLELFDVEEVRQLSSSVGIDLTTHQAQRLHTHTGGHPLYVRTLLTELTSTELHALDGDLPAPQSLKSAVAARLADTPETSRALAAAMAVLNQRVALTVAGLVAGVESPVDAFEKVLDTGLARWNPTEPGPPVEFAHPLYRQAIYDDLPPSRRRELHRAAAGVTGSAVALSHRIAAADGADEDLAGELEAKAKQDLELGLYAEAARTLRWASSLSPARPDAERRLLEAAWAYIDPGQTVRLEPLRSEIEACHDGLERSLALGMLAWDEGRIDEARYWLYRVVNGPVSLDPEARIRTARAWGELAEIHVALAEAPEAARAASRALALSPPFTSAERLARIHGALAEAHLRGPGAGLAHIQQRLPQPPEDIRGEEVNLLVVRATLAQHAGLTRAAVADLRAVVALARRGTGPVELARAHRQLGMALTTLGEWDEALVQARTGLALASDDHRGTEMASCHAAIAALLAYRGEFERAEKHASAAADSAARLGVFEGAGMARLSAAAIGVASGDPEKTIEALDPMRALAPMLAGLAFWPTLVAALIDSGQLERAQTSLEGLEAAATARGLRMDARINGLRARLAAACGELEQADTLFRLALPGFGPDEPYLEKALTRMAHARLQRTLGRHQEAVNTLREVQEALSSIGGSPFVDRVESDLYEMAARPARRKTRSPLELTDREHDVAVLVAQGYSNPEAADALYVSRKAVEFHLRNIYGKLGITSRRQLRGLTL